MLGNWYSYRDSYVEKKECQRWLWHAIDHNTGVILAYTFGNRKDEVFQELQELLKPFRIKKFYTDDWGAYERNLEKHEHEHELEKEILKE